MDAIVADRFPVREPSRAETASFQFTSPHRSLQAFGMGETIRLPALGADQPLFPLQEAVRGALQRARQAGQDDPIVVGAIPFDLAQPCCLFVPESWRAVPREPLGAFQAPGPSHRVMVTRSLPEREGFQDAVARAIAAFRAGPVRKAVLSRILEIELARPVNPVEVQEALTAQNPGGFHFQVPLPEGGVLLGASPELLIRKTGRIIRSNPLAGSAKRRADREEDRMAGLHLLRSRKDAYEHKLVTDGIRQVLAPLCPVLNVPDEPELMNTPTMWHLSTTITGEVAEAGLSVLRLACLMHPTPAVCGSPTPEARSLIRQLEPFDRGLFSGIVGWCNADGDGEWAITIRCGTIEGRRVRLFAGAGIVEESDPRSEWAETEAKLGTMLRAFGIQAGAAS